MSSLAPHVGRESEVVALGKVWLVGRFDLDVIEKVLEWVRPQLPDPFAGLDGLIDKLPPEKALELVREAQAKKEEYATLDYDSPAVKKFLDTKRGQLHTFWLLLQANHPDATFKEACKVAEVLGERELAKTFENAAGRAPVVPNAQAPAA